MRLFFSPLVFAVWSIWRSGLTFFLSRLQCRPALCFSLAPSPTRPIPFLFQCVKHTRSTVAHIHIMPYNNAYGVPHTQRHTTIYIYSLDAETQYGMHDVNLSIKSRKWGHTNDLCCLYNNVYILSYIRSHLRRFASVCAILQWGLRARRRRRPGAILCVFVSTVGQCLCGGRQWPPMETAMRLLYILKSELMPSILAALCWASWAARSRFDSFDFKLFNKITM